MVSANMPEHTSRTTRPSLPLYSTYALLAILLWAMPGGMAFASSSSAPAAKASKMTAKKTAKKTVKKAAKKKVTPPVVEGLWDTPGGRIEITRSAAQVKGIVLVPAHSGFRAGELVLEGSFFEDSLAGQLRLGLLAPRCAASSESADALLLLTRSGKLVGGFAASDECLGDLRSASLERVEGAGGAERAQMRMVGPPVDSGSYDPRGYRKRPLPGSVEEKMEEGALLLGEGRFEKAQAEFLQVIKLDPSLGEAYNGVGVSYYARNDLETAVEWYKRGLEASPGFGDLYYNLACAYAVLERPNMALRYLRLAALKGYSEGQLVDEDPDLKPLQTHPDYPAIRKLFGPSTPVESQP